MFLKLLPSDQVQILIFASFTGYILSHCILGLDRYSALTINLADTDIPLIGIGIISISIGIR